MTAVCEHVAFDRDTALCVIAPAPAPGPFPVCCPCCGLSGWAEDDDDLAGMACPYCAVYAVRDNRVEATP